MSWSAEGVAHYCTHGRKDAPPFGDFLPCECKTEADCDWVRKPCSFCWEERVCARTYGNRLICVVCRERLG